MASGNYLTPDGLWARLPIQAIKKINKNIPHHNTPHYNTFKEGNKKRTYLLINTSPDSPVNNIRLGVQIGTGIVHYQTTNLRLPGLRLFYVFDKLLLLFRGAINSRSRRVSIRAPIISESSSKRATKGQKCSFNSSSSSCSYPTMRETQHVLFFLSGLSYVISGLTPISHISAFTLSIHVFSRRLLLRFIFNNGMKLIACNRLYSC